MTEQAQTRIAAARERADAVKVLLAGGAVGAFGVLLALARLSHPAAAQAPQAVVPSQASNTAPPAAESYDSQGDEYGGGSIAPSQDDGFSGPSLRSGTS